MFSSFRTRRDEAGQFTFVEPRLTTPELQKVMQI